MSLKVLSLLMKTSVLCIVLSANSWQPLIFLLSPQFCLSQNGIQVESPSFSLKWEVQTLYETTPGPPRPGLDRLQAASSPTTCCSFPSSTGPVQQPRGGQGDTCWVSVHKKATRFVPLVTVNPDSCRVCYKQMSHFFRPPALSTPLTLLFHFHQEVFSSSTIALKLHLLWDSYHLSSYSPPLLTTSASGYSPWSPFISDFGTWFIIFLFTHIHQGSFSCVWKMTSSNSLSLASRQQWCVRLCFTHP